MPSRRSEILANSEVYHVFNRSNANEQIFVGKKDNFHALELMDFYRYPQNMRFSFFKRLSFDMKSEYVKNYKNHDKLVDIYAFCLMPDHYHILLRQINDNGVKSFISNFQNSYAKYFNKLYQRNGSVFQRPFKAKRITSDEELLHISRYIHLNPASSYLSNIEDLHLYSWSSYKYYFNKEKIDLVDINLVSGISGSSGKYIKFVENNADYQRKLNRIRHLRFD